MQRYSIERVWGRGWENRRWKEDENGDYIRFDDAEYELTILREKLEKIKSVAQKWLDLVDGDDDENSGRCFCDTCHMARKIIKHIGKGE